MKPGPMADVAIRNIAPISVDRVLDFIADPLPPAGPSDEGPADRRTGRWAVGSDGGLDEDSAMVLS
jgi:hypothetical protein